MTKTQLERKIKHLINESKRRSIARIEHLLNSGALDVEGEKADQWGMAKVCASHLLQAEADNHKPLSHGYRSMLNNLGRF